MLNVDYIKLFNLHLSKFCINPIHIRSDLKCMVEKGKNTKKA